jgi:uncharacterized protein (TIGR02996 family)
MEHDLEAGLIDALRRPHDRKLRLVWADLLGDRGDPRGEQLILEDRVELGTGEDAAWLAAAERLLRVAAERGFVAVPDDPDASVLPWEGGGGYPVQYELTWDRHHYYTRYRHHGFTVDRDGAEVLSAELDVADSGDWTSEETNFFLHLLSDAIREGRLETLTFPSAIDRARDPRHRLGAFPRYSLPDELAGSRKRTLAARDLDRWWALHARWQAARQR